MHEPPIHAMLRHDGQHDELCFFCAGLICASAKLSPSARMVQGHDDFDTVNDETLYITMAWMCIKPVISSPDHRHYEVTRSTCRTGSSFYHYKANGLCLSNLASSEAE